MADWYPQGMDSRAAWHANFAANLPALAAKYNITAGQQTSVTSDNTFIQFWVAVRHSASAFSQQLTRFFNDIAGKDPTIDPPAPIIFEVPDGPTQVEPGIEFRTREIARQIKGHSAFSEADGESLGIVSGGGDTDAPEPTLEFAVTTLAAFEVEVTFKKRGMDAVKFQFRYPGGTWQPAATILDSPGSFAIAPQEPNTAQQIELRGVYLKGNQETGGFSDAKSAFIAP